MFSIVIFLLFFLIIISEKYAFLFAKLRVFDVNFRVLFFFAVFFVPPDCKKKVTHATRMFLFNFVFKRNLISASKMVQGKIQALVLCGPSGAGKSTLLQRLFKEYPDRFGFSVSHTTRQPRPGEVDGVHYHFTKKEEMEEAIKNGDFIESAVFSCNIYGTRLHTIFINTNMTFV